MYRNIVILIICIFISINTYSQGQSIRGVVYDLSTNQPLKFASVGLANKSNGVITNGQGHFRYFIENINSADTFAVSYLGYETYKVPANDLIQTMQIGLKPEVIDIDEIMVSSKKLSAEQIIDSMKANFITTHPDTQLYQQCFLHNEFCTHIKRSDVHLDKSTVDGLDNDFIEKVTNIFPEKVYTYEQHSFDIYGRSFRNFKYKPIKSIRLDDSWQFENEFEKEFKHLDTTFFRNNKHVKIRSGVVPLPTGYKKQQRKKKKREKENAKIIAAEKEKAITKGGKKEADKKHIEQRKPAPLEKDERYVRSVKSKARMANTVQRNVVNKDNTQWDFLYKYGRYNYTVTKKTGIAEPVYIIEFMPKRGQADFAGKMVVSAMNFALVQLEYAYGKGREGTSVEILGITYRENINSGIVQYEKVNGAYYLKFLHFEKAEEYGINRPIAIKEAQKEQPGGKRGRIKGDLDILVNESTVRQLLVVSRKFITQEDIKAFKEPFKMKVEKITQYNPKNWAEFSIIEPSENLKAYKKQFE